MKKNGFIATSLIYSFFLIFITLFLTIIADYLQNKVLLNTIEKGIKDELNSSMSISDFEVGDILYISKDIGDSTLIKESNWIIAGVNYNYDEIDGFLNSKLILYNIKPVSYPTTVDFDKCISEEILKTDLMNSGNLNDTRLNDILYNTESDYDLSDKNNEVFKISSNCAKIDNSNIDFSACDKTSVSNSCRERVEYNIGNKKIVVNPDSGEGLITVTGVK